MSAVATTPRLSTFAHGQRVKVVDATLPNEYPKVITINALGTVERVRRDGGAWVTLDERSVEALHPFDKDDSRGRNVLAYPDGCEAPTETRAAGNRKERRQHKVLAAEAAEGPPTLAMFGKDHWSTFGYIETRVVDHRGEPDRRHMRCHHGRHPLQAHSGGDAAKYPTKLKGGVERHNHDDWDCIDDLEREGLLENVGSGVNPVFRLTKRGQEVAKQLRSYKGEGGNFATFTPEITS